jgi:hypothetical protein
VNRHGIDTKSRLLASSSTFISSPPLLPKDKFYDTIGVISLGVLVASIALGISCQFNPAILFQSDILIKPLFFTLRTVL